MTMREFAELKAIAKLISQLPEQSKHDLLRVIEYLGQNQKGA